MSKKNKDDEEQNLIEKEKNKEKEDTEDTDNDNFYGWVGDKYEPSGARNENIFESIGYCVCPKISIKQFIVIITLIELFIFIVTCCVYGLDNSAFLAPDARGISWGWSDVKKIRNNWQIWRFITPTVLHGHFEHILGNFIGQLYMGTGIENGIGLLNIIVLYWLCGLGGILLSMNVRPNTHGVGASTAIFGLVGFYFSYIFSYWFYMGRVRCGQRIFLVIYVFLLVLLNSPLMQSDPHTDNIGHLGGFITGILVGFAITEQIDQQAFNKDKTPDRFTDQEYNNKSTCCYFFRRFFQVLSALWFLALFVYFYTIDVSKIPDDDES